MILKFLTVSKFRKLRIASFEDSIPQNNVRYRLQNSELEREFRNSINQFLTKKGEKGNQLFVGLWNGSAYVSEFVG
jgi:hypothetical protein